MKARLSIAAIGIAIVVSSFNRDAEYPVDVTTCDQSKRAAGFTVVQNYTSRLYVFGSDCQVVDVVDLGTWPANHIVVDGTEYFGVGGEGFFHVKGGEFKTRGPEAAIRRQLGEDVFLHHDSIVLPNENYLSIAKVKHPNGASDDVLVEFTAVGEIAKQLSVSEIMLGRPDAALSLPLGDMTEDWLHTNSLALGPDGLIVSVRNLSTVLVLDWETGEVVRSFGPDFLSQPHDIEWEDDISAYTAFDNGVAGGASSIAVIERDGRLRSRIPMPFFARAYGSVEVLENGNWLVLNGMAAEVYEFAASGEIVAQFQLAERHPIPFLRDESGNFLHRILAYRAYHTEERIKENWPKENLPNAQ